MNYHANLTVVEVPLPADGALMLAVRNADQIAHDIDMAVRCRSWDGHVNYVRNAREQLAELACRLGYDLVPSIGGN